jgi:hypothetical protein
MTVNVVMQILGGLAFLAGAVISIKNGAIQFKSGYQLQRNTDPLGFWALVIILAGGGLFFFINVTFQLYHFFESP